MKTKLFITGLALMAVTLFVTAQNQQSSGTKGNGQCKSACNVDKNKNSACCNKNAQANNKSTAVCKTNGQCKGKNFVDANKNGVCDKAETKTAK
jgi:hypothetical protein